MGKLRIPRPPRAPEVPVPDFEATDEIESSCNTEPHKKRVRAPGAFEGRRRKPNAPRPGPVLNVRPAEECIRRPKARVLPPDDPTPASLVDCAVTPPPINDGVVRDSPANADNVTPAAARADRNTPAPRTHERRRLSFSVPETPDAAIVGAEPDSHPALQTNSEERAPGRVAFKSQESFSVPETPEGPSEVGAGDGGDGGALALHPSLQVETARTEVESAGAAASRRRSRSVSVSGSEWSAGSDRGGAVDAHPSLAVHTLEEDCAPVPLPATERFPESQLDEDDDAWADYAAPLPDPVLTTAAPRGLLEQLEDAVASSCERGASDKENASPSGGCSKRTEPSRKRSTDHPSTRRCSEGALSASDAGVTPLSAHVLVPPTPTPTPRRPRPRMLVPTGATPSPALSDVVPETQTPHALRGSTDCAPTAKETPLTTHSCRALAVNVTPHEREIIVPPTPSSVGTDARTPSTVRTEAKLNVKRRRSSFLVPPTPETATPPTRPRHSPRRRRRSVHWEDTPAQMDGAAPAEKDDAADGESAKAAPAASGDAGERVLFRPFRAGGGAPAAAAKPNGANVSHANREARMTESRTDGCIGVRSQPNYEAGMTPAKASSFAGRSQPNYEAGMTPEGGCFNRMAFMSSQPDYAAGQSPSPPRYVLPPAFPQSPPLCDESSAADDACGEPPAVRSKLFKAFDPAPAAASVGRPEREPTPTPRYEPTPPVDSPRCRGALRVMRYGRGRGTDVRRTPMGDAACSKALELMRARARAKRAACPLEYTPEERRRSPPDLTPRRLHEEAPAGGGVTVGYRDDVLVACVGSDSD